MLNSAARNDKLPKLVGKVTGWHDDRNLIEGTDDWNQTKKLLEEFLELLAAQMPDAHPNQIAYQAKKWITELNHDGRIKSVKPDDAALAKQDSLADMTVVAINIMERNKWTFQETLEGGYNEIKDRSGVMLNGTFVKDTDL